MFSYNQLAAEIHQNNVDAGWWSDMNTGESLIGKRNIGELLCLVHSEASEALEGKMGDLMDDKLPHRYMAEVEMADAGIRLYDTCGAYKVDLDHYITQLPMLCPFEQWQNGLLFLHYAISQAMEGFRKNNMEVAHQNLARSLWLVYHLGAMFGSDFNGAIAEKRAYNLNRADHKLENRKKADGKRF